MSRSYKKNPIVKDNGCSKKEQKTMANRKLRRKLNNSNFEIANNNSYKKHYEQWCICDYRSFWSLRDALKQYKNPETNAWYKHCPTEKEFIVFWKKTMLGK